MDDQTDILFLSDNPNSGVAADLDLLYPGRVKRMSFVAQDCTAATLSGFKYVVTMVCDGRNIEELDYAAIEEYACGGGTVVSCLFEYARHRGLTFSKTHVLDRLRPALRIEEETPITRGYAKGDEVWWYGAVSSAPDQMYANQMMQRQILDVAESTDIQILATSTVNGGAVSTSKVLVSPVCPLPSLALRGAVVAVSPMVSCPVQTPAVKAPLWVGVSAMGVLRS